MKPASWLLAGTLALSACGTPSPTAREVVAGAATLYASTRIAYVAYANLPRCVVAPPPCSDAARIVQIGQTLLGAREAVDLARNVVDTLPETTTVAALTPEQRKAVDGAAQAVANAQVAVEETK